AHLGCGRVRVGDRGVGTLAQRVQPIRQHLDAAERDPFDTGRFHGLIMRRSKPECDARFGQRYAGWVSARRRVESTPLLGRSQSASRSVLWVAAAKRATKASEIFSGSGAGRLLSGGGKPA